MDDNRKLAEEIWRVAVQQPGGEDTITYIAAALSVYGEARYKAGQESMRKEVPDVVVTWASGETVGINDVAKRIKELEELVREFDIALQSLTPGGSEFVNAGDYTALEALVRELREVLEYIQDHTITYDFEKRIAAVLVEPQEGKEESRE